MKKILALLLAICFVLSLVACGKPKDDPGGNTSTPTTTVTTPTTAPTDASTTEPTFAPTVTPTEGTTIVPTVMPTELPTQIPTECSTKAPTESPTKATTFPTRKPITVVKPTTKPTAEPITVPATTPTTAPTDALTTAPTWTLGSTPTTKPTIEPTAAVTVPTAEPTTAPTVAPTKTPLHPQTIPYTEFKKEYPTDKEIYARHGTAWDSEVELDVPIYYADEVIGYGSAYHFYKLASDCSHVFRSPGEYGNQAEEQFYRFPTNAIRMREDGTSYFVYDTETDYRLYVFVADFGYLMGYPIVINKNKMHSYNDFMDIQVGDSIEKVAAVDDIMELYKEVLYDDYYIPIVFETRKKMNDPVASVHYLKDGILRIEYAMPEEGSIVVANIEFFEDYIIPTADGKLTSHKIKNIDLPVS